MSDEEIGAFQGGKPKELKIPGLAAPIAIEIERKPYFPVADVQGTVRLLIDGETGEITKQNGCDAFGVGLIGEIPYAYAGKRYDANTGLLYFGKRYYDPSLHRWLTPDPLGPVDHSNLYQYVFNNPFLYRDPTGQFAFVIPLLVWGAEWALPALAACVAPVVYGAITGAVAYGGYQLVKAFHEQGTPCMGDYYSGDLTPDIAVYKDGQGRRSSDEPGSPPYRGDKLGNDPTKPPANGFEWRGDGPPGNKQGSWVKGSKKDGDLQSLRPDLDHPKPIGSHWDYSGRDTPSGARLFPDGTWEPK